MQSLQLPGAAYNPTKYPNPALQWHYKILQALALEEEVPEQPDDATVPKYRQIHRRCGGFIEEWSACADEELAKHEEQKAIKRDLDGDDDDDEPRPAKKAKKAPTASSNKDNGDEGSVLTDVVVKKKANSGELSKLKVTELRDILAVRGLEMKGLKAALVERVEQWAEENS
jgi:ATP-dependent DNA helicase 2 subunit 1